MTAVPAAVHRAVARLEALVAAEARRQGVAPDRELRDALAIVRAVGRHLEYGGSAAVPVRPERDWVSTMTYANAVGISDRAARKRCLNGTVRCARDRAGRWRIDPQELTR
jgi:hypothetical protein